MLRECPDHGYARAAECPDCGAEGDFLMNDEELNHLGRIMAGILRHFPDRFGLEMDDHGWVDLEAMVEAIRDERDRFHWLRPRHVNAIAATDPKGRYEIDEGRIRATYAHSLELDWDFPTDGIPESLYYPVAEEELDLVLERGLSPNDRALVHLSETYESALSAGLQRVENPIILEVAAQKAAEDGNTVWNASKTVYTTEHVPGEYLSRAQ
jgi:putative RNA 2'-phosphotransferase